MIVRILLCDIQSVGFICKLLRLNAAVFVGEVGKAFAVIYLRFTLASDALAFMFAWARCDFCGGAGPQKCINYDHCIFHILYHHEIYTYIAQPRFCHSSHHRTFGNVVGFFFCAFVH